MSHVNSVHGNRSGKKVIMQCYAVDVHLYR